MLLVDSAWRIPPELRAGSLEIGVPQPPTGQHPSQRLNGVVLTIFDESDTAIVRAPPEICVRYPQNLRGRWVRIEEPLPAGLPNDEIFRLATQSDPRQDRLQGQPVQGGGLRIRGVLYPEEVRWRGLRGGVLDDAWLFVVELRPSLYDAKARKPRNRAHRRPAAMTYLVR